MLNFIKTLYASFFISGVTTLVSYGLTIYLTYAVVPTEYGHYLYAIAWAGILAAIIDWSTAVVFSHLVEKSKNLTLAINIVLTIKLIIFTVITTLILIIILLDLELPVRAYLFLFRYLILASYLNIKGNFVFHENNSFRKSTIIILVLILNFLLSFSSFVHFVYFGFRKFNILTIIYSQERIREM